MPFTSTRLVALLLAACLAPGCSTTIHMRDGRVAEAEILGANFSHIYIEGPSGEIVALSRMNISEIDHPGRGVAIAGTVLAGAGTLVAAIGVAALATLSSCQTPENDTMGGFGCGIQYLIGAGLTGIGAVLLTPGIPMTAGGWAAYGRSASRASAGSGAPPGATPTGTQSCTGAGGHCASGVCRFGFKSSETYMGCPDKCCLPVAGPGTFEAGRVRCVEDGGFCTDSPTCPEWARVADDSLGCQGTCCIIIKSEKGGAEPAEETPTPETAEPTEEPAPADEAAPADEEVPDDEWQSTEDPPSIRFLGIAPVAGGDRDLKGVVVGFSF